MKLFVFSPFLEKQVVGFFFFCLFIALLNPLTLREIILRSLITGKNLSGKDLQRSRETQCVYHEQMDKQILL